MTALSHRIRLDLNNVQETWFYRSAGTARFTWNWGLARWEELHEAGEKPSWQDLNKELNTAKKVEFLWMSELPWKITNTALSDLGKAFQAFFRRVKQGEKPGYPRFKKRGRAKESFCIEGRGLRFDGRKLRIPKLGWVRMREALRFPGKVLSARFSEAAGNWYASILVEIDEARWSYPHRCETQAAVGVDLGLADLAVLSDGARVEAPRALRRYEVKLRRLNKELARRIKGSANWYKTRAKLAKLHRRIANIRRDVTHKLTANLVRHFRWIGIEDLCVKSMARTRLAKSVMDAAMAEVPRQLAYKALLAGGTVVIASRWFPSTKTCSVCNNIVDALPLSTRAWSCPSCESVHNRDVNAAINLKNMAEAHSVTACCQGSTGTSRGAELPLGQEWSSCVNC